MGHIITSISGEDWLIDTGSPQSFGVKNLSLCAAEIELPSGFMGIDTGFLTKHIGLELCGLIGVDILNNYDIVFDLPNERITFFDAIEDPRGYELSLKLYMGIPLLRVRINEEAMTGFFDTGAQISYASPQALKPEDKIGTFNDFYPVLGAFETELYRINLVLGDISLDCDCGVFPDILHSMLTVANAQCIIGNTLLEQHRMIYMPRSGKVLIS